MFEPWQYSLKKAYRHSSRSSQTRSLHRKGLPSWCLTRFCECRSNGHRHPVRPLILTALKLQSSGFSRGSQPQVEPPRTPSPLLANLLLSAMTDAGSKHLGWLIPALRQSRLAHLISMHYRIGLIQLCIELEAVDCRSDAANWYLPTSDGLCAASEQSG